VPLQEKDWSLAQGFGRTSVPSKGCVMGQLGVGHLAIILISLAMWVGAGWVIVIAVRRMGLFNRRRK
jgi:hypothetical protein